MTDLSVVRDTKRFRVHGDDDSFRVSRLNDSREAQMAFGGLTNDVSRSPVAGYDAELEMDNHTGRPFQIWFRKKTSADESW